MKIPKQIQIAGKIYNIVFENDLDKCSGCHGEMRYNKTEIAIDSNFNKQLQQEAFIHECLHGILNVVCRDMNTESIVHSISELLYQVIKQIEEK